METRLLKGKRLNFAQGEKMGVHPDLVLANALVYEPNELMYTNLVNEIESGEYGACEFEMGGMRIKFRAGKITPTKVGQFVTLWKRIGDGDIQPYDVTDPVDLFVVSARSGEQLGQFVFPKAILHEKGVLSNEGKGGKRAMRIYPPWDRTESRQAQKTQSWQLPYFLEILPIKKYQRIEMKNLYKIGNNPVIL